MERVNKNKHSSSEYLSAAQRLSAFTEPIVIYDSPRWKDIEANDIADTSIHESSFDSVELSKEGKKKNETQLNNSGLIQN